MNLENGEKQIMLSSKLGSPSQHSEASTMDSFQDGGQQQHMNTEHTEYQSGMEAPYMMNPEMNNYGPNPGEQGMANESYSRMNDGLHHTPMSQYNSYNRQGYSNMENNNSGGSDYSGHGGAYGQYGQPGSRPGFSSMPRPGMPQMRPGMGSHGMGMMPGGYNPNQQRMLSGQSISQQSGPTPTLNQLLQTPNAQPRFQHNSYDGTYGGPQKGGDMGGANGPYGVPQGWMQNQRGMGSYPQMPMSGSAMYRGQGPANYNQGFNQSMPPNAQQAQYNSQGSIQQQPQPPGQPPGSSPQQQRPTPQPSPHQRVSPAPSPVQRVTPNPSPGPPARPAPQPSPGQPRSSQPSPSPSQRSSSSQLSPPGSSPGQHNSFPNVQHNHQSSPKDSSGEDVKGELTQNNSRPEPSPGSVGSRSNTPASNSGSSPMPPRPPSQQDGAQNNVRMSSQSPMPAPGYNQQMMPPPMGPNQMGTGGYSQGNKMAPGSYPPHYPNSQYAQSGNYSMRQPGMGNYQPNMYNGPSQMGPGGQPMYNNIGGPGMNRNYNMYGAPGGHNNMMPMNSQYGNYSGPGQNSQAVPPGPSPPMGNQTGPGVSMGSPGPNTNGPQGSVNSMGSNSSGSNGQMPPGPQGQGQIPSSQSGPMTAAAPGSAQGGPTPTKGAQAAAQAAMAAASAAARSQANPVPPRPAMNMGQSQRMYNAMPMGSPHSMPPQSMSPLSQMGQMNQMGYGSTMNNMPHPQNSVSPVPNAMGHQQNMPGGGKMHNSSSVNCYSEQPLPKSKSSKSKSVTSNSSLPPSNLANSLPGDKHSNSPLMPQDNNVPSPMVPDSNIPSTQQLPSCTPTSSLPDINSHSNDLSNMGPVKNSDHSSSMPPSGPISDNSISTSGNQAQKEGENMNTASQNDEQPPITTTANHMPVDTTTTVTQSITSPVTSISTDAGNSNDSQPLPMEPVSAMQNCIPVVPPLTDDPPEKKRKTDSSSNLMPFARVAPSPGGASVASSGTHEDIDNIGSPGWPSTPKSGAGDHMKLFEMGNELGRRPFLDRLFCFLEEKGAPITNMPVISKQPLDLYKLYLCVQERGGMVEVTKLKKWKEICGLVNISGSASAAFTLKKNYIKFLFGYECRFDRGGMDPTPILAQMETDLEKKRAAKQRNRAPSPAGSQSSQDGMQGPNQYMQNDPSMGNMGIMGNPMMNNMGGPMMGPNNMGGPGPHHMGPGMQGPGHMMGGMGPQGGMMGPGGNSGYMMQGGPNNMMGNNMGPGPQGGMMGPGGMQGPNGMMGNMGPQSGNMMHGNMNQHGMMNNMNMPANSMMQQQPQPQQPQNNMMPAAGNMPYQQGMMPPNSMNQGPMRSGMNQPPNSAPMIPPNSMMRGNSESVSCQDPFADEPHGRAGGNQVPPFHGMGSQGNSGMPTSGSPMPPNSGGMPVPSSSSTLPSQQQPSSTDSPASSSPAGMMPQQQQPPTDMPSNTPSMPQHSSSEGNSNTTSMPPNSSMAAQNSGSFTMATGNSGVSTTTTVPSTANSQPNTFSQDSNSSLGEGSNKGTEPSQNTNPQSAPMTSAPNDPQSSGPTQFGNNNPPSSISSASGRQFPFGDQFTKPDRFEQGSPSLSQSNNPPMAQGPMMNQQPGMPHPQMGMNQQGPAPYMNPQQPPMSDPSGYQGRYGNQMPPQGPQGPDHFNQGPQFNNQGGGYTGPRPMMNNDGYQGYPNQQGQYGKPPMNRDMSGSIYNTPNKRFPDGRNDSYMSPGHMGSMPYTPSRPMYPDYGGVDNTPAAYGGGQGGYAGGYGDTNMSHYPSPHPYNDYSPMGDTSGHGPDRGNPNQWSPMPPQRGFHNVPSYGPPPPPTGGPPNMTRLRMSPNRNRDYSGSPKQKMSSHSMQGHYKKDMHFPLDSIESTQPLLSKRRRLTRHDIGPLGYKYIPSGPNRRNRGMASTGQIEAWRIMMSLKSGLLAESTWALDTLNILLFDDSTVTYFGLAHLPGLLEVLLDHFRRCLIEMFDQFNDTQIGCGHEEFKQNLIRMAILESAKEAGSDSENEQKEIKRANKSIVKIESLVKDDSVEKEIKQEKTDETTESSNNSETKEKEKEKEQENVQKESSTDSLQDLKSRANFTLLTRQGKEVKIEEESDPNGLLDAKIWDVYCEFGDQSDLWEYGKGDLTEHIVTHLEDINENKRCKKKFFRKRRHVKDESEDVEMKSIEINSTEKDKTSSDLPKLEPMEVDSSSTTDVKECETRESKSPVTSEPLDNDKAETGSNGESSDDKCDKDHTCNQFLQGVTIKTEPRDPILDKIDSSEKPCDDNPVEIKSFFRDEPRIKLAVKYELLTEDELVQTCKNSFGLNTDGERNGVEDESYQRNEPPLCLTSEAHNEVGRRCVCISNIFRSLSCIPGNDLEMSRHAGLVYILSKLLLLHHKHLPRSRIRRKFDRDDVNEDMVDISQGQDEWWWDSLNVIRENILVIFANICAQLRLDVFPYEICEPVLDGLLHWVVCPSSCASDPLPTVSPVSVLSPLRLVLEAMCKLCIYDRNVDMLLASPPYERIVQLFSVLTKLLANKSEQVTVEFSIVLLSELVRGGSSAARGVALQHPSISLLIDFLETAEQKAVQVANMHSIQMLRDNPEMMGTSLDMLRRAATVLLHLAKVPANRRLFVHHQSRLLSLVMSQILDQTVGSILSDVLYQCSQAS